MIWILVLLIPDTAAPVRNLPLVIARAYGSEEACRQAKEDWRKVYRDADLQCLPALWRTPVSLRP